MIGKNIIKVTDGAYFVPSYSEQTITRSYEVWGTVHMVGAADELLQEDPNDTLDLLAEIAAPAPTALRPTSG